MMRTRCPELGMSENSRSLGSRSGTDASTGTSLDSFHTSKKSAPIDGLRISCFCGGAPSETTTDFPASLWPVTIRLMNAVTPESSLRNYVNRQRILITGIQGLLPVGALHKVLGQAIPRLGQGGVDATSRKYREAPFIERTGRFVQLPVQPPALTKAGNLPN